MKSYVRKHCLFLFASFLIPVCILAGCYFQLGIYPGGERTVLASDAFGQFANFHASYRNALLGKQSFLYTWNASLGLNYLALAAYYLGGLFTPFVFFFPNDKIAEAMYWITLLKIGTSGLSFWLFAHRTYRLPRLNLLTLSVSYALMSFVVAHSELIMWLDAFVYLPLIILGIHRLMDQKKPVLLFVTYLLLFLSNFYMGFMIGVFSFLYYFARALTNWKLYRGSILDYLITALSAGGASMVIILPTILDLWMNGESMAKVFKWKTSASGFWDIIVKNMIGVYDTTKNGSIPFIYVGLFPLLLCLYYFISRQIPWKKKLAYGSLFLVLIASFYLVPLNLFWHGMDSPNMFHFRYAYLFSFLVVVLAGYGWEKMYLYQVGRFAYLPLVYLAIVALAISSFSENKYTYVTSKHFTLTALFLLGYFFCLLLRKKGIISIKGFTLLLFVWTTTETVLNTNGILNGILQEWNYATQAEFGGNYPWIQTLVDQADNESDSFFRLENLDNVSANDSFNYGYSGVSMFSSIRNRNSSSYLNTLGFRSRGSNLTIRYLNNTLVMDSFVGIGYNIKKDTLGKFGFRQISEAGDYYLYKNYLALPLAFTAPDTVASLRPLPEDILANQTNLLNELSALDQEYFQEVEPTLIEQKYVHIHETEDEVVYTNAAENQGKILTWEVKIPEHSQAYLSLYPTAFTELGRASVKLSVNRYTKKSLIGANGQFHNLGYYPKEAVLRFTTNFYACDEIRLKPPKVVFLNTQAFKKSVAAIQNNGADLEVSQRKVAGEVTIDKNKLLLTTIPYDKGWRAYVDGKRVEILPFNGAFVSLEMSEGTHNVVFSYLPYGLIPGIGISLLCIILFIIYWWRTKTNAT